MPELKFTRFILICIVLVFLMNLISATTISTFPNSNTYRSSTWIATRNCGTLCTCSFSGSLYDYMIGGHMLHQYIGHSYSGTSSTTNLARALFNFNITKIMSNIDYYSIDSATFNFKIAEYQWDRLNADKSDLTLSFYNLTKYWRDNSGIPCDTSRMGNNSVGYDGTSWYERCYGDNSWTGSGTCDWTNKGGDFVSSAFTTSSIDADCGGTCEGGILGSINVPVGNIKAWLNNPSTNYGFIVKSGESTTNDERISIAGAGYGNKGDYLNITYTPYITIISPTSNQIFTEDNPTARFNVTTAINMTECRWSPNSGITNYTLIRHNATNFGLVNTTMTDSSSTIIYYCNQSSDGVWKKSSEVSFEVDSVNITRCRNLTVANRIYQLKNNIVSSAEECIKINNQNITLNMNYYNLSTSYIEGHYGIFSTSYSYNVFNGYIYSSGNTGRGIYTQTGNLKIENMTINMSDGASAGLAYGILFALPGSDSSIINTKIISPILTSKAIKISYYDNINITNSIFNSNISLSDTAINIILLNTTYLNDNVIDSSSLYRKWYLDVQVNGSTGLAIQNALVTAYNSTGSQIFSLLTNAQGTIAQQQLIEYINNGGTKTYQTPHNITISKSGYTTNTTTYNISLVNNIYHRVTLLSTSPPTITLSSPINNYQSPYYSQQFECNSSATGLKNITFYLWNSTNSVINTTSRTISGTSNSSQFNYTFSYPDYYKWNCLAYSLDELSAWAISNFTFINNATLSLNYGTNSDTGNVSRSWIYANVTYDIFNFANVTFSLNDANGIVNSTTFTTPTYSINWTELADSKYTYNITVRDNGTLVNYTASRIIIIDTQIPQIEYDYMQNNASQNWIFVSVNLTETNPKNITFTLGTTNVTTFADIFRYIDDFDGNRNTPDNWAQSGFDTKSRTLLNVSYQDKYSMNVTINTSRDGISNYGSFQSAINQNWSSYQKFSFKIKILNYSQNLTGISIKFGDAVSGNSQDNFTQCYYRPVWYNDTNWHNFDFYLDYAKNPSAYSCSSPGIMNWNNIKQLRFNIEYGAGFGATDSQFNVLFDDIKINKNLEINWTNLADGIYTYNVSTYDTLGNFNSTETRTITLDASSPTLNILSPQARTYNINTIDLNYTVSDIGVGLSACWYKNNTNNNITITCGTNTTISQANDGTYTLYFWANDTLNNIVSDEIIYSISTTAPSVVLDNPTDNKWLSYKNNILFNFTATDSDDISTCELWGNWTGIWKLNQTLTSVTSGVQTNFSLINLADGRYKWNVWCNDTLDNGQFALNNYTINIDTIYPLISYGTGTENNGVNLSRNWIYVNISLIEINFKNITFTLTSVNSTTFTTPTYSINWTNLADGTYTYNVSVYDTLGNFNSTETRTITLDKTNPNATLIYPVNNTYNSTTSQNMTGNLSDNLGIKNATLYIYNQSGEYNQTTINFAPSTTQKLLGIVVAFVDGIYKWFYNLFDWAGNSYTTGNYTLTIDTIPPRITIYSPLNTTYIVGEVDLKVGSNEAISSWKYSLNGASNVTFTPNTTIVANLGSNTLLVYGNDSTNNLNYTSVTFSTSFSDSIEIDLTTSPSELKIGSNMTTIADVNSTYGIVFCNFTLASPSAQIFTNQNGTLSGELWYSPYQIINQSGTWDYNVTCMNTLGTSLMASDSVIIGSYIMNYTPANYSFTAISSPDETNILWVYLYDNVDTNINYTLTSAITGSENFTLNIPTSITLDDTDSQLAPSSFNMTINATALIPEGTYYGNISMFNQITGQTFYVYFTYGIKPPSGLPVIYTTTDAQCTSVWGSPCSNTITIQQGSSYTLRYKVGNTGGYALSNCSFHYTHDLESVSWISSSSFDLPIGNIEIISIIFNPTTSVSPIIGMTSYFYIHCNSADSLNNSIDTPITNRPFNKLSITEKSKIPPSGGGGIPETIILNITELPHCGNKICEDGRKNTTNLGENIFTCSEDCQLNIEEDFGNCFSSDVSKRADCLLWKSWAISLIFGFIGIILLLTLFFTIKKENNKNKLVIMPFWKKWKKKRYKRKVI